MRVPIPNSEEYLLLRELTHRMNNEFASAAYCRRWLGLASILRRSLVREPDAGNLPVRDSIVRHIFGDWRKTAPSEAILPKHSRSCAFTKLGCDIEADESVH